MSKRHYNLTITGRVQGVGFRYSVLSVAKELGINGFVRNQSDGSVYIEAEGEKETLDAFAGWCREGPGFARIRDVFIQEAPLLHYTCFDIHH